MTDAVVGSVWVWSSALNLGSSGPTRVDTSKNDPDVKPPRVLGFTASLDDSEPLLWDGDDS